MCNRTPSLNQWLMDADLDQRFLVTLYLSTAVVLPTLKQIRSHVSDEATSTAVGGSAKLLVRSKYCQGVIELKGNAI